MTDLDYWIAEHIEGLVPGVDIGVGEHQWKREANGEIDEYGWQDDYSGMAGPSCQRCWEMPAIIWNETLEDAIKKAGPCVVEPKEYSTDIRYAMPLAEKYGLSVLNTDDGIAAGKFQGRVFERHGYLELSGDFEPYAFADTPSMAICLALKKTKEG